KGDWSDFEGTLTASLSKRGSSYDPEFYWDNNYGLPKATLSVSPTTVFDAGSRDLVLGGLTGKGTVKTTGTVTVGSNDGNFTCVTSFSGNPRLVKTGTGDWKVSTALSTDMRSITVNDGKMSLGAKNQMACMVNVPLTLEGSALLRGAGTVKTFTAKEGAVVKPGNFSESNNKHYGPLYVSDDATFEEGSELALYIRKADNATNSRSFINVTGTLTLNGKVTVTLDDGYTPQIGDVIDLWNVGTFVGVPVIELPELPGGLFWDITGLFDASGELKVTDTEGISDIYADPAAEGRMFDIMGRPVGNGYHGIVIVNGKKYFRK
ncbi:MAG: hypothetical protein K2K05_12295, partial [Muribaculaceae bacterium]|nr:hypothetical protein [Muribaculaceae bacterium]